MAADRVDNRFWGCNTRVVVCGPAIETELGFFARFYFAAYGCRRVWQSGTDHAFRTIVGWLWRFRIPILYSESIWFPTGHAALSPFFAWFNSLHSIRANDSCSCLARRS